ncbi:hypothetical protein ZWY2020_009494 [Hordeum vulgare]|nr:hypothetical protein ZWY2020_009494 [Hordeum vulgare]
MVIDVARWRAGGYSRRWRRMAVQKEEKRIYSPSLPPFLLVLAGEIMPVDHRWNQHGLGGDNAEGGAGASTRAPSACCTGAGREAVAAARHPEAVHRRLPLGAPRPLQAAATAIEERAAAVTVFDE